MPVTPPTAAITYTQALEPEPKLEVQPIMQSENAFPHIALLLPLDDKNFGDAAQAVRDGFMAAASLNPNGLPVLVYNKFDENMNAVEAYRKAVANGARAVVGPLTRKGVGALAAERNIPVPTLALNIVDAHPADQLLFFGLSAEAEARTAADIAAQQNLHKAVVISTTSPLSQRIAFTFEEEWSKLGLTTVREIDYTGDSKVFAGQFTIPNPAYTKQAADSDEPPIPEVLIVPDTLVFLATDTQTARLIRPYLPNRFPIYATSQIFGGNDDTLTNYDLNGIRFVDMPWLLQPDHPAVIAFPHSTDTLTVDKERLYALGVDAYRLAQAMLTNSLSTALPMQGVTGLIQLNDHVLQRTPVAGMFAQGRAISTSKVPPSIQMFPDQFKNQP